MGAKTRASRADGLTVLIVHGPNLNLLGSRDTSIYGDLTLAELDAMIAAHASARGAKIVSRQTNLEGEIVSWLHEAAIGFDAVVMNPGGYTHTSVAIRDAIDAIGVPVVEVHLSNIHGREDFRARSLTAAHCIGQIAGFGAQSYLLGVDAALAHVKGLRSL